MKTHQLITPDQSRKWLTGYVLIAFAGFCYCLGITIFYLAIPSEQELDHFFYAFVYFTPAFYTVLPLELVLLGMTLYHWRDWSTSTQRLLLMLFSIGAIILTGILMFF